MKEENDKTQRLIIIIVDHSKPTPQVVRSIVVEDPRLGIVESYNQQNSGSGRVAVLA